MDMLVDLLMGTSVHGSFGCGGKKPGDKILEFGDVTEIVVANT